MGERWHVVVITGEVMAACPEIGEKVLFERRIASHMAWLLPYHQATP